MTEAIAGWLHPEALAPRCAEPQRRARPEREMFAPPPQAVVPPARPGSRSMRRSTQRGKPWQRIEQALRAMDLLLQSGGFGVVVLDMASIAPEYAARVPMATWFRYRAAAERTQASVLLLTQHPCAKSSCELLLRLQPGRARGDESTIFTGCAHRLEVERRRFTLATDNVVPLRKPPQRVSAAEWHTQAAWAGPR